MIWYFIFYNGDNVKIRVRYKIGLRLQWISIGIKNFDGEQKNRKNFGIFGKFSFIALQVNLWIYYVVVVYEERILIFSYNIDCIDKTSVKLRFKAYYPISNDSNLRKNQQFSMIKDSVIDIERETKNRWVKTIDNENKWFSIVSRTELIKYSLNFIVSLFNEEIYLIFIHLKIWFFQFFIHWVFDVVVVELFFKIKNLFSLF